MSVLQQAMVWRLELPHNKAWVLMALADHAHDDGTRCFPGVEQLAWKTGYGARQVRRILHDLRGDGIIEAVAFVQGGRGRATEYTLYLDRGTLKPLYGPDRGDRTKPDILTLAFSGKDDIPGPRCNARCRPSACRLWSSALSSWAHPPGGKPLPRSLIYT